MFAKLSCYLILLLSVSSAKSNNPHIVFICVDDLGWNDVSLHGSNQIMTPNIDILGHDGIILHQYYTDCQGTPSRSSLFTGKYAMRLGTQGVSISAAEDRGVPVSERFLPSYLRSLGYATHLIGKWQLGNSREQFLPTEKGFDSYYGYTTGCVDYFTYNHAENVNGSTYYGLDFFNNLDPIENQRGYITEVLTDRAVKLIRNHDTEQPLYLHISHAAPHIGGGLVNLQAPEDAIEDNHHIAHTSRRLYASMVTTLDKNIGHVVGALAEKEMLNNTIIVIVSDNGADSVGPFSNFGSNWPLRGTKGSPWEGAIRSLGLIWHSSFRPQVKNDMFHVTDWLPTLVAAAGGNVTDTIDGINYWNSLVKEEKPIRNHALLTLDDLNGWVAYREGDFKIIMGDVTDNISQYYGTELKEVRLTPPSYEESLLNSETMHVFKETLKRNMDIDQALTKRSNLTLLGNNNNKTELSCIPTKKQGCLYNITADPLETNDLWTSSSEVIRHLALRVRFFWSQMYPRRQVLLDARSQPALHNFVWLPWLTSDDKEPERLTLLPEFPLQISVGELKYLVDVNMKTFSEAMTDYVKSMTEALVESVSSLFSF